MKNQNDLIVIGVCVVFAIGASLTLFFMKREPTALAAPQAVITTDPAFSKDTNPAMGDSLPGGGSGAGGFGGGFGGGFRGGAGMGPAPTGTPGSMMSGMGGAGSPMGGKKNMTPASIGK